MKTNKTLKEVLYTSFNCFCFKLWKKILKMHPLYHPASPSYFYHLHFCIVKTLLLQEVLYTPNQVVEDGSGSFSLNHFPKGGRWYRLKDPKWKNHLLWLCVTIIRKFVSYDTYLAVTLPHKYYTDRARGQATHHYSHCSRCFSFSSNLLHVQGVLY